MMKKSYETPTAEKVTFQYQQQVAASNQNCTNEWTNLGDSNCQDFEIVKNFVN